MIIISILRSLLVLFLACRLSQSHSTCNNY